jgi:murein DD-endopeptidase MepM/ murein hydrolase activator NlpD
MRKILLSLLILSTLLSAKSYRWEKGTTFLSFLKKNNIPQKLYYNLDSDDKELMAEIRAGQKYTKDANKILIPVTDELQIQILKSNKEYKISLEPIPFDLLKGSIHLKIKESLEKELYAKTHSRGLIKSLKQVYHNSIKFNKMKKGDSVTIFYEQKRRDGKAISNPKILASLVTINKKKFYSYLTEDGRYYDSTGKEYRKIKKSFTPYIRPVNHVRISSGFTHRRYHPILHRYKAHLGVDYAGRIGTPIKATAKGKIIYKGWKGGYGKCIIISHGGGMRSLYAHMSRYRKGLKVGSYVPQGKVIGYIGSTGRSTGPHLHFGMYKHGKAINPGRYVQLKKTKIIVNRLKGKAYRALRKKVVSYRKKFKHVERSGDDPIYVKKGDYLIKRKELS